MSFGKMTGNLTLIQKVYSTDDEGFKSSTENIIKTVKCYRESRHGSLKWANLATFSEATDLFRFRKVPNVSTDLIFEYNGERYIPLSVEYIKGMYIEALAKRIEPTSG